MKLEDIAVAMGLAPGEAGKIVAEVKENRDRLKACVRPHVFEPCEDKKWPHHHLCRKCGGRVSLSAACWYTEGLGDAGKDEHEQE